MRELACEMCGSTNVVKQDGLFVCQTCGTKYSPEEAKKIMEGTVEVTGTVKVDSSAELENLYEIARRARDSENSENALKYYDQILMKDANSWEAQFYVVYFRAMNCRIIEMAQSAQSIYNSFDSVLNLIKNNVTNEQEQMEAVREVVDRSSYISTLLFNAAVKYYPDLGSDQRKEYSVYASESLVIPYTLGDKLIEIFGDKYKLKTIELYKLGIILSLTFIPEFVYNEGIVNFVFTYIEKIVKLNSPSELENLYEIARKAIDSLNSLKSHLIFAATALKNIALECYDMILAKDPKSWEAQFYLVYTRAMGCEDTELGTSAQSIYNSFDSILHSIKNNISQEQKQIEAIKEVADRSSHISTLMFNRVKDIWYRPSTDSDQRKEYSVYASESIAIPFTLGDKLIEIFGDKYKFKAIELYKFGIDLLSSEAFITINREKEISNLSFTYSNKIREVDGSYNPPKIQKVSACYVATSIYGSYDCPEVWTLRRFRDNTLAKSIPGRIFIKFYYAISPTVVKYFGDTQIFKNFFKLRLDKLVSRLQEEGVDSSFYIDE